MRVNELLPNEKIAIESANEDCTISLDSTVCEITNEEDLSVINHLKERYPSIDFCFINGIHEAEYLIDFTSPNVVNDLVYVLNGKPIGWKKVRIMNLTLPQYGRVHVVMTTTGELPYNRRAFFRLDINHEGELLLGEDKKKEIIIKDLSASGVGFLTDDLTGIEMGGVCKIFFNLGQKFNLSGYVRRVIELENGKILVGCEFQETSQGIAQFISEKQREKHANQRRPAR